MSQNYSKHKDRSPEQTVFAAQKILNDIGLFPVMSWYEAECGGAFSNRVTLYPTNIGTNGKGTDKRYATASGYAELMERMQNSMLFREVEYLFPDLIEKAGFARFPDEKLMSISEVLDQGNIFFDAFFNYLGIKERDFQELFINNFYQQKRLIINAGKIRVVPFANTSNNSVVWLPLSLVFFICGSNGMAAGNTFEEAMVQGLSEIFERFVHEKIIKGEVIPPEIPRDYLKKFAVYDLIEKFESGGRYSVSIIDGSLGKGFPVAASIITDKENGTFAITFGSHPSFSVAVERTLTEAAQGVEAREKITKKCQIGTQEQVHAQHNILNTMKNGSGIYPYDLLLKRPDWEFSPWGYSDQTSNKELLKNMLELIKREGMTLLVRDVSFLGFPACFMIVPGVSEIGAQDLNYNLRLNNTLSQLRDDIEKFPYLSAENEAKLLIAIQSVEHGVLLNRISYLFFRPVNGKRMTTTRVGAYLALKLGNYELSKHFFERLSRHEKDDNEKRYLKAMIAYVTYLKDGLSNQEAHKLLRKLFAEDLAERIISETPDLDKIMAINFPHMKCFDCEHCELSGTECMYQNEKKIYAKILDALKKGKDRVSQESVLKFLQEIKSGN